MRGAKPTLDNVIPMKGLSRRLPPAVLARRLCPRRLPPDLRKEWLRVGTLLADPDGRSAEAAICRHDHRILHCDYPASRTPPVLQRPQTR